MLKRESGGPSRNGAIGAFQTLAGFQPGDESRGAYPYPYAPVSNLLAVGGAL